MEPSSPKKIQFAVPLFQSQLDPQAAEQIRRRRPTPATLVIFNDQTPPEADEQRTTNSQGQAESAEMSPKQRKQSVYNPPTMKAELQLVVEQHLQRQEQLEPDYSEHDPSCLDQLSPMTNECCHGNGALPTTTEWGTCNFPEPNGNEPCVKLLLSTADHPDSSCTGGKLIAENLLRQLHNSSMESYCSRHQPLNNLAPSHVC
ncbi:hypothetical protein HHUSO_G12952 [Huso huso]|uniref:Protein phosphatase 1 regulatory subunit 1C n=1 Tax=Huso huso TaxID=61971 RepID=A0ABR0ZJR3_HUSHU